ncbi:hypothetical protein Ocin01_15792, partial [Orchesella cincta]
LLAGVVAISVSSSLPSKFGETKSPYGSCKTFQSYTPVHFFDLNRFTHPRIWYVREIYYLSNEANVSSQSLACYSISMVESWAPSVVNLFWRYQVHSLGQRFEDVMNYTIKSDLFPLESVWAEVVSKDPIVLKEPYTPMIWVQTDYDNWAIAYDCRSFGTSDDEGYSLESMVLYTKDPYYNDNKTLDILSILIANYGFSAQNMRVVNHTNCNPPY